MTIQMTDPEALKHTALEGVASGSEQQSDVQTAISEMTNVHLAQYPFLKRLHDFERWIACKLGGGQNFETQGINRIAEEHKHPPSIWSMLLIWLSMVLHLGMLPIGFLGPALGLDFSGAVAACVSSICIGAVFPAAIGILGPKLGLRQMALSRYTFGYWGTKLTSVLMILSSVSFLVINAVVVGEVLSAVSDFRMSITVGCVLVMVATYIPTFFGFRTIIAFENVLWVVSAVLLIVLYIQATPEIDISIPARVGGLAYAGAWLSFFTLQFSNTCGWATMAGDYYCNYPKDTSKTKIFVLTWLGIALPTIFVNILGIILGQATFGDSQPPFAQMYEKHGLGGVLSIAWRPAAWAKVAQVFSALTVLGNNIAVAYSSGMCTQLLGSFFHAVPRFIWSLIICIVALLLSVLGRKHLSTIVENFVSLLGYWVVSYASMLVIEDAVFRRGTHYDLAAWNDRSRLPLGVAAVFTLIVAYIAGGFMGMAQTWFTGPIAAKFGPGGGDVGIFMSFGITVIFYPATRWLEKRWTRR